MRFLVALAVACAIAQADTVFLKDGSKVEGKVVGVANGKVGVKTAEGKMVWLDEASVDHVEKASPPKPPDEPPPKDPDPGVDPAAEPPVDPPEPPPKGPLKGPKCPDCKGKKMVKCPSCTDGMADVPCVQCDGNGSIKCAACEGAGNHPCPCGGKKTDCPKCAGYGREDCSSCFSGAVNCPGCAGMRMVRGPCPDCKKKKKVRCPACQGTGVDPKTAQPEGTPGEAPPPDPATEPPPEETAETPVEPAVEEPPKEPEKPKMPAAALSSPSVEVLFGVVEGLNRTDGMKLWKVTVKLTNGEEMGSLVVKAGDFSLVVDDGKTANALIPGTGHPDAAPKMIGKAATKEFRLYFETARDRTPKTLRFTNPKWKGEPFTIDLPKPK